MIIRDILSAAGIEVHTSPNKKYEVTINCPFCHERGETEDTRFRLGINTQTGLGHCYNCGWKSGSILTTVHELSHAFGLKYSIRSIKRDIEIAEAQPQPIAEATVVGYPDEYEPFSGKSDEIEQKAMEYLRFRKVSILQIHRHKIGFAAVGKYAWRIIFPVLGEDGQCYGSCTRDFSGIQEPKYLNTPGIKMLWGTERMGSVAVITEGIMDALKTERALLSTPNSIALAKLGSALTQVQLHQLKQYDKRIILPDWDIPGLGGAIEMANRCADSGMQVSVCIPETMNDSDPGSMRISQIREILANAVPWNKSTEWRMRAAAKK